MYKWDWRETEGEGEGRAAWGQGDGLGKDGGRGGAWASEKSLTVGETVWEENEAPVCLWRER